MVLALACAAPGPEATVISVGDDDTIRVWMNGKPITVRLACNREGGALAQAWRLRAPELAQRINGQNAWQYLQQRLPVGSTVTLDEKTTDRYGRLVAEVFNGINIKLAMLEDG